jgi:hypothetical protein
MGDYDAPRALMFIAGVENPAGRGFDAQDLEEYRRDTRGDHTV